MILAIYKGQLSEPMYGAVGECPSCGEEVVAKCGDVNVHHWAHKSLVDCDSWSEPESALHYEYKQKIAKMFGGVVEYTIEKGGVRHRADVYIPSTGKVVEVQCSPISPESIREREEFYGDMVWFLPNEDKSRFKVSKNMLKTENYSFVRSVRKKHLFWWKYGKRTFAHARSPIVVHHKGDSTSLHITEFTGLSGECSIVKPTDILKTHTQCPCCVDVQRKLTYKLAVLEEEKHAEEKRLEERTRLLREEYEESERRHVLSEEKSRVERASELERSRLEKFKTEHKKKEDRRQLRLVTRRTRRSKFKREKRARLRKEREEIRKKEHEEKERTECVPIVTAIYWDVVRAMMHGSKYSERQLRTLVANKIHGDVLFEKIKNTCVCIPKNTAGNRMLEDVYTCKK